MNKNFAGVGSKLEKAVRKSMEDIYINIDILDFIALQTNFTSGDSGIEGLEKIFLIQERHHKYNDFLLFNYAFAIARYYCSDDHIDVRIFTDYPHEFNCWFMRKDL